MFVGIKKYITDTNQPKAGFKSKPGKIGFHEMSLQKGNVKFLTAPEYGPRFETAILIISVTLAVANNS